MSTELDGCLAGDLGEYVKGNHDRTILISERQTAMSATLDAVVLTGRVTETATLRLAEIAEKREAREVAKSEREEEMRGEAASWFRGWFDKWGIWVLAAAYFLLAPAARPFMLRAMGVPPEQVEIVASEQPRPMQVAPEESDARNP